MSVGDLHDVERTGEFAVTLRRPRRRPDSANVGASGSVPITVLTDDAALADAIHDAAAAAHPVAVASTLDELLELAANGRCGILITDQVSAQLTLRRAMQRLRETEPALVAIAVGSNNDQPGLISLLSAGVVDRLMLKPVTPSLAQIVLKSAVQQHKTLQGPGTAVTPLEPQVMHHREPAMVLVELQQHAANDLTAIRLDQQPSPAEVVIPASMVATATPSRRIDVPRPPWFAVVAALLAVAGLMWWLGADRKPAIDAQAVVASNLAAAERAFRDGQTLEPRGHSAFDYYNTVLALDPSNAAARQGIDQIADRFAAQAGIAIARGHLAAAIVALESVRRVRPEHRQLAQLQAQLNAAQEKYVAAVPKQVAPTPPPLKEAPVSTASTKLHQDVEAQARAVAQAAEALKRDQATLANAQQRHAKDDLLQRVLQRTAENKLVEPADDSAKFHLQRLVQLDANFAGIQQGLAALGGRLTVNARLATAEKNFDVAAGLLAQAREIGFSGADIDAAEAKLAAARLPMAAPVAAVPNPRLIRIVRPDYPREARISGAEGWVNVSMSVTPAGGVLDPRVEESSNGKLFDRAALAAVRKWKYEPFAAADPQRLTVRVEFKMKNGR